MPRLHSLAAAALLCTAPAFAANRPTTIAAVDVATATQ
jgi:hypothetical protein